MSDSPLDLSRLAIQRTPPDPLASGPATNAGPRRRRWITRYALPLGILMGFITLLGAAAGRQWIPARPVTVVPVIVKLADVQQAGTTLFQSPGWIEPRPTAIRVAALASGVIEDLMVVEGQFVKRGEPVAKLIAIDSELMVEQAENVLAIRDGELLRADAELNAARIRFANPLHLEVQIADAQSMLAKAQTELAKLPFLIKAGEANLNYTLNSMEGKRSAKGAISGRIIALAENEHASTQATLQELRQRTPNLQRELDALSDKVNALKRQRELLIEETRQVQEAEAKVGSAAALRDEAKLRVRQAKLTLDRNVVRAPMDGRVLRLVAAPGARVMGKDSNAGQGSGTVVEMYDPDRLQVRADVRLEDVPMVTRGQPVEIETASSAVVILGRVLQTTSSANIQKNTLEVKIELIDPPPTVSPEMLVTATFLAPPVKPSSGKTSASKKSNEDASQTERMFVPSPLVNTGDAGAFVWVVDSSNSARKRAVQVGRTVGEGLVEIKSGLKITDKLIASGVDGFSEGDPVQVTGDNQTMGMK